MTLPWAQTMGRTKTSITPSLKPPLHPSVGAHAVCFLQHWQLGCNLWPNVADKDVSVETSRVRLAPSPGILVPGCSAGLPSLAAAPHMCFLFLFFFQSPFLELCLVWPLGIILILVHDRIPTNLQSSWFAWCCYYFNIAFYFNTPPYWQIYSTSSHVPVWESFGNNRIMSARYSGLNPDSRARRYCIIKH